jgi:LPXTG-site transpeptidase (sortase) family protein
MIVAIIAVCIVALIAVFSVMWRISGGVISRTINSFNRYVKIQNLDYNFKVPEAKAVEPEPTEEPNDSETDSEEEPAPTPVPQYNYNFSIPFFETDRNLFRLEDGILSDAKTLGMATRSNELTTIPYQVQIPKIALASLVSSGLGESDLLQKGFWLHPDSKDLLTGEAIFLCHRQFFSPNDRRSCWFLDKLEIGDKIYITNLTSELFEYEIISVVLKDVSASNLDEIYTVSGTETTLKIVSSAPLNSSDKRIVVTAKLISPNPAEENE